MVLTGESEEELKLLRHGMRQSLRPVGEFEEELVERMVAATWRKRRGERVELGLWDWREYVSGGKSTLANVFFMDSQHDQSLQKLTRYMMSYSTDFRRAWQMLREAQAARREEADGADWADVEADETSSGDENQDADGGDDPEDDPAGGSSAGPTSESVTAAQVTDFVRGPDWQTRAECSTPPRKVDPRAPRDETRRDSSTPTRWQDLSGEEKILFAVRNKNRVLAANEIIDEVLLNKQSAERMSPLNLIRTSSALHNMIWQTTLGIDKLIEQEDRRQGRGH